MRSFSSHPAYQSYDHPHKEKILLYLELMYAVGSELNKIDNLEERKLTAAKRADLDGEVMQTIFSEEDKDFQELRHKYLSEFQFHNKYQNLITYQQMLWNVQRAAMNNMVTSDDDAVRKFVDSRDKTTDLMEKLEGLCARLFSEIYGDGKTIEIAKENIRQAMSPEERMKTKQK